MGAEREGVAGERERGMVGDEEDWGEGRGGVGVDGVQVMGSETWDDLGTDMGEEMEDGMVISAANCEANLSLPRPFRCRPWVVKSLTERLLSKSKNVIFVSLR